MQPVMVGNYFQDFLNVIQNRFINKEERWGFTQSMSEDPIFFTSITYYKMLVENNNLLDLPAKALVFSDQWDMTAKKEFEHGIIKRKFPKSIDTPVIGYYPPNGFVGWHTNCEAHGYIILFNWSEDGEGFFRYIKDGKMDTLKDGKGWSCKVGYFGNTPEDYLWHCARTECRRFSFSYRFQNKEDWQQAVDLIQS